MNLLGRAAEFLVPALVLVAMPSGAAGAAIGLGFPVRLVDAEAVAAVEIVRADYKATAADGPMYAEARVLGVVKGSLPRNTPLKFGETAWCGPTYQVGDLRILFLLRVISRAYFSAASWATVCRPGDRLDVYFSPDALPLLSPAHLRVYLEDMQTLSKAPPRLKVTAAARSQRSIVLSIGLTNVDRQTLWINPARLLVTYDVGKVRSSATVRLGGGVGSDWTAIFPARGISGTVTLPRGTLGDQQRLVLTVAHHALYFPHRTWAGTLTAAPVPVGD